MATPPGWPVRPGGPLRQSLAHALTKAHLLATHYHCQKHNGARTTMSIAPSQKAETTGQLRKAMGFWDVLLFNIATVLGPRWIAAAGHNGTSSISLWVLAALLFFIPGAFVINELSSRFPEEGGLYAWS